MDQTVPHDFDGMGERALAKAAHSKEPGVYFLMNSEDRGFGKLIGFEPETLERYYNGFDICIMEADGARQKLLKGWAAHEPAVPSFITKTVGIINLRLLGDPVTEANIHRPAEFLKLTGGEAGDAVTLSGIERIVSHPDGLFRHARGERILFINMAESPAEISQAENFLKRFGVGAPFDRAVYGSLFNRDYHIWLP